MKKIIKISFLLVFVLILTGCFKTNSNTSLYQEDYDGNCFRPKITWSEMALCLKTDRDKEWEQNKLANNIAK